MPTPEKIAVSLIRLLEAGFIETITMIRYYYDHDKEDLNNTGFSGEGWYFWDETQSRCYGPYGGYVDVWDNKNKYIKKLEESRNGKIDTQS